MIQNRIYEPPRAPASRRPGGNQHARQLVAIRAPRELDAVFRRAGGTWIPALAAGSSNAVASDPSSAPCASSPMFRHAGLQLD